MAVIGAILGDIAGSQYEFSGNELSFRKRPSDLDARSCSLYTDKCRFTDDTVMTLAVKKAVDTKQDFGKVMHELGRHYLTCGYGSRFLRWLINPNPKQGNSTGNGSAMRVSYIGEYFDNLDDVKKYARESAKVSHNSYEGIKGAEVTAVCVWMARHGKSKQEIYDYVLSQYPVEKYDFSIDKPIEYLVQRYRWDGRCSNSVPVAMRCFYESTNYESFIRNVFRLKGDVDTLCAIGGGVAEEFYHGLGFEYDKLLTIYLDKRLYSILMRRG